MILVDDQVLARHVAGIQGAGPDALATTATWWWRLARSVAGCGMPELAVDGLAHHLTVPERNDLLPAMARLATAFRLNVVAAEALAAAEVLGADIVVAREVPRLRGAARVRGVTYLVRR